MSSLSFVALSMQTTHLDPATVSKASYLKMVDGQITRFDSISIIPPTAASDSETDQPQDAVPWHDTLSQLGMVIGKLPIVSYYRDADKEIFQAASRRSDTPLPTFHWLDCRALARKLLPELPDHQPSTVLKALDLYDEHADSGTVEQTAQIVLQLAANYEATTVSDLWGDIYDQPDDLLGLEATLKGLSSPESDLPTDETENTQESAPTGAAVLPGVTPDEEPIQPVSEKTVRQSFDEPTVETEEPAETATVDEPEDADNPVTVASPGEDSTEPQNWHLQTDTEAPVTLDAGEKETEEFDDSTAESVIQSENLDQPEFLKVPDSEEPDSDGPFGHQDVNETHSDPLLDGYATDENDSESHPVGMDELDESELDQEPVTSPATSQADFQSPAAEDEAAFVQPKPDPVADDLSEGDHEGYEPEGADSPNAAEVTTPPPSADTKPFDPVYQVRTPAPVPRPGARKPSSPVATQPVEVEDIRPSPVQEPQKYSARTGRMWAILGMIVFGLLTIVGMVLTVMATLLFFTTNNLLLETKVAGVILTSAITLLSLLMATLSYRTYRKK